MIICLFFVLLNTNLDIQSYHKPELLILLTKNLSPSWSRPKTKILKSNLCANMQWFNVECIPDRFLFITSLANLSSFLWYALYIIGERYKVQMGLGKKIIPYLPLLFNNFVTLYEGLYFYPSILYNRGYAFISGKRHIRHYISIYGLTQIS